MVLKPEPIFRAVEYLTHRYQASTRSIALLTPQGELFNQEMAKRLSELDQLVFICGRYEGVDERVSEFLADRELSVGDFVLSGGELAAAVVVEAVTRLLPGALGNERSAQQESFSAAPDFRATGEPDSTCSSGGLLDYRHYTRPAEFRGMRVPEELVSGNHEQIRAWRRRRALEKTLRHRPELLDEVALSGEDRDLVARLKR